MKNWLVQYKSGPEAEWLTYSANAHRKEALAEFHVLQSVKTTGSLEAQQTYAIVRIAWHTNGRTEIYY